MKTNRKLSRIFAAALMPVLFAGTILCPIRVSASDNGDVNTCVPQTLITKPAPAPVSIVENPEVPPQFKDGMEEIFHRLAQNMEYPKDAAAAKEQGKVVIEFVVNTNGTASDFKIVKSSGFASLDQEALRVCQDQLSSDWIPAKDKGQAVAATYTVPVMYRLQ